MMQSVADIPVEKGQLSLPLWKMHLSKEDAPIFLISYLSMGGLVSSWKSMCEHIHKIYIQANKWNQGSYLGRNLHHLKFILSKGTDSRCGWLQSLNTCPLLGPFVGLQTKKLQWKFIGGFCSLNYHSFTKCNFWRCVCYIYLFDVHVVNIWELNQP